MSLQPQSHANYNAIVGNSSPFAERYVGVDLAITGPNVFVCLDSHFQPIGKPLYARFGSPELDDVLTTVRHGLAPDAPVFWIMEPTGGAWPGMVAYLTSRGEQFLFMPATRRSSSLRKSLSPSVKSDVVDAMALAKTPIVDHRMTPLSLPSPSLQALKRLVNLLNDCSDDIAKVKLRLRAAVELYNPGALRLIIGDGDFTPVIIRFIQQCWDPRAVTSEDQLREFLITKGRGPKLQEKKLLELWTLCQRNATLLQAYTVAGHLPAECSSLGIEIQMLLEQFKAIESRRDKLEVERDRWMESFPGGRSIQTLYGIGGHIAAEIIAYTGDINRFKNVKAYKCYVGLISGSTQSGGDKPPVNTSIHRRGPSTLKQAFYLAAKTAIRWDPQLAEFAVRLQNRQKNYVQVIVAVANKLVARVYSLLKRSAAQTDSNTTIVYQLKTPEHSLIAPEDAKALIDAQYRMRSKRYPNPSRGEVADTIDASVETSTLSEESPAPASTPTPVSTPASTSAPATAQTDARGRIEDARGSSRALVNILTTQLSMELAQKGAKESSRPRLLPPALASSNGTAFRIEVTSHTPPGGLTTGLPEREMANAVHTSDEAMVFQSALARRGDSDWLERIECCTVSQEMRQRLRASLALLVAEDQGSLWDLLGKPHPIEFLVNASLDLYLRRQEQKMLRR